MTYKFKTISLRKLYIFQLVSVSIALIVPYILLILLSKVFTISGELVPLLIVILTLIPMVFLINIVQKRLAKETIVKLNSRKIVIDKSHTFSVENIKKISVTSRFNFTLYPSLKIHFTDKTNYKIRSYDRYNLHFEKLITDLRATLN